MAYDPILEALNPTGKKESQPGQINDINEAYSGAEGDNEISSLESALAGIASGILIIPDTIPANADSNDDISLSPSAPE